MEDNEEAKTREKNNIREQKDGDKGSEKVKRESKREEERITTWRRQKKQAV